MNSSLTDHATVDVLYLQENDEWHKQLQVNNQEIAQLQSMLHCSIVNTHVTTEEALTGDQLLQHQLKLTRERLKELTAALDLQQWRLLHDTRHGTIGNIHLLCSQDILRQQIKDILRGYNELKHSLLNYLPVAL